MTHLPTWHHHQLTNLFNCIDTKERSERSALFLCATTYMMLGVDSSMPTECHAEPRRSTTFGTAGRRLMLDVDSVYCCPVKLYFSKKRGYF